MKNNDGIEAVVDQLARLRSGYDAGMDAYYADNRIVASDLPNIAVDGKYDADFMRNYFIALRDMTLVHHTGRAYFLIMREITKLMDEALPLVRIVDDGRMSDFIGVIAPVNFATMGIQQLLRIAENEVVDYDDFDAIPAETHQAVLDMIVSLNCAVDNSKRGWDVQK